MFLSITEIVHASHIRLERNVHRLYYSQPSVIVQQCYRFVDIVSSSISEYFVVVSFVKCDKPQHIAKHHLSVTFVVCFLLLSVRSLCSFWKYIEDSTWNILNHYNRRGFIGKFVRLWRLHLTVLLVRRSSVHNDVRIE